MAMQLVEGLQLAGATAALTAGNGSTWLAPSAGPLSGSTRPPRVQAAIVSEPGDTTGVVAGDDVTQRQLELIAKLAAFEPTLTLMGGCAEDA
jgi:hypothetical protein